MFSLHNLILASKSSRSFYANCADDPFWNNVVLLMHFNNEGSPTNFIEETGKSITVNGNASLDSSQSKFGGFSGYFNGTSKSSYLATPVSNDFVFGTGDFTIEFWAYKVTNGVEGYDIVFNTSSDWNSGGFWLELSSTRGLFLYNASTSQTILQIEVNPNDSQWHHWAITRENGTFCAFKDGSMIGSSTVTVNLLANGFYNNILIGKRQDNALSTYNFNGYIDDFRITKGVARYTENNTKLLMHFNQRTGFSDLVLGVPSRTAGSPAISIADKKVGSSSLYLNGSSYLIYDSQVPSVNAGSTTFEMWFKSTVADNGILLCSDTGIGAYYAYFGISVWGGKLLVTFVNSFNWNVLDITANTWYHLAVVTDITTNPNYLTVNIYVNGSSVYSNFITSPTSATFNVVLGAIYNVSQFPSGGYGFTGYVDEVRISNIARYTANFTPSLTPFITDANTKLLCHFEGSAGGIWPEETGKSITVNGNPLISSTQNKFGGYSGYFDGTGANYLTIPANHDFAFGTGDFTIEFWIYFNVLSGGYNLIDSRVGIVTTPWVIAVSGPNAGAGWPANIFGWYNGGYNVTSGITPQINTWYHVAYARKSNVLSILVNGQSYLSIAENSNITATNIIVGRGNDGQFYPNCYIDELRITKGKALYSGSGDVLLMHFDPNTGFVEETGKAVTVVGNPAISATQSKFGGYSGYFDGNVANDVRVLSADFGFGLDDFTIDLWVYVIGTGQQCLIEIGAWNNPGSICLTYNNNAFNVLNKNASAGTWITSPSVSNNTWYHLALVRFGSTWTLYVNGVNSGSATYSGAISLSWNGLIIGTFMNSSSLQLHGYIDELRITKGLARYTANFTVPNAPFTLESYATKDSSGNLLPPTSPFTYEGTVVSDSNPIPPVAAFPSCRT